MERVAGHGKSISSLKKEVGKPTSFFFKIGDNRYNHGIIKMNLGVILIYKRTFLNLKGEE